MTQRRLTNPGQVIRELGGPTKFGRLIGRSKQMAAYYVRKGIPSRFERIVSAALARIDCAASDSVFTFARRSRR